MKTCIRLAALSIVLVAWAPAQAQIVKGIGADGTPRNLLVSDGGALVVLSQGTAAGAATATQGLDGGYPVKVDQGAGGASAWKVDGSAVTQPVTAAQATAASLNATVTQGPAAAQTAPWQVQAQAYPCVTLKSSVCSVGVAAATCPATQLTGRLWITYCNSTENTATPTVKIRPDGTSPVIGLGNIGSVVQVGGCIWFPAGAAITPKAISDTAATDVQVTECGNQ